MWEGHYNPRGMTPSYQQRRGCVRVLLYVCILFRSGQGSPPPLQSNWDRKTDANSPSSEPRRDTRQVGVSCNGSLTLESGHVRAIRTGNVPSSVWCHPDPMPCQHRLQEVVAFKIQGVSWLTSSHLCLHFLKFWLGTMFISTVFLMMFTCFKNFTSVRRHSGKVRCNPALFTMQESLTFWTRPNHPPSCAIIVFH